MAIFEENGTTRTWNLDGDFDNHSKVIALILWLQSRLEKDGGISFATKRGMNTTIIHLQPLEAEYKISELIAARLQFLWRPVVATKFKDGWIMHSPTKKAYHRWRRQRLLIASWDKMVIHWDMSWLESTHGHNADRKKEVVSMQDSTGDFTEISRFVGNEVRLFSLFCRTPLTDAHPLGLCSCCFYNWITSGSRDKTVSGMCILLHRSVLSMVMEVFVRLISVVLWLSFSRGCGSPSDDLELYKPVASTLFKARFRTHHVDRSLSIHTKY